MIDCRFVFLISWDSKGSDFRAITLNTNHNCENIFKNSRACTTTWHNISRVNEIRRAILIVILWSIYQNMGWNKVKEGF